MVCFSSTHHLCRFHWALKIQPVSALVFFTVRMLGGRGSGEELLHQGAMGTPWIDENCHKLQEKMMKMPSIPIGDTLWWTNIAIENGHLLWIYPLKMVICHCYVSSPEGTPFFKMTKPFRGNDDSTIKLRVFPCHFHTNTFPYVHMTATWVKWCINPLGFLGVFPYVSDV